MQPIQGIHHITAVASNPQKNVDFYQTVLGQRLVKTTVNFDDPGTYHLYYGDEVGSPGTIMTFFPWQGMRRGVTGNGEVGASAYTIAPESVGYWHDRLKKLGVTTSKVETRFNAEVIPFRDPDGMRLELIAEAGSPSPRNWFSGPIPAEHILHGFHGVTLWLAKAEPTLNLLADQLGYQLGEQEANRWRLRANPQALGFYVDVLEQPNLGRGQMGSGSVHHVAFRTRDDSEQIEYQTKLNAAGFNVTPVRDRQYFHSIYFREPGGVLFEIATDAPGFLHDEPLETLGHQLKLPPWLEEHRPTIAASLPELDRAIKEPVEG